MAELQCVQKWKETIRELMSVQRKTEVLMLLSEVPVLERGSGPAKPIPMV